MKIKRSLVCSRHIFSEKMKEFLLCEVLRTDAKRRKQKLTDFNTQPTAAAVSKRANSVHPARPRGQLSVTKHVRTERSRELGRTVLGNPFTCQDAGGGGKVCCDWWLWSSGRPSLVITAPSLSIPPFTIYFIHLFILFFFNLST